MSDFYKRNLFNRRSAKNITRMMNHTGKMRTVLSLCKQAHLPFSVASVLTFI